ncbi:siderophore ABC transporter substrate-binding protein [Bosea minatitlanensis]|uniref:Siderophore ABC transporter substrate-binding protein n=1 Tax=Bosea minatitlanensis TaxID=128782 RepID=A0ABW0FB25_9HYPH|nr:siderophore ABC transporter substrate-binding protein [Bosea minatitlanensis]MCT4494894.1 siderophore ABC transporter substrate-binding protein [Bosea minatitlanensis]
MPCDRRQFLRQIAGAALLAIPAAGGRAHAAPVTVKHDRGELSLPGIPARVATFDLTALDTLDALGVPVAGVPDFTMPSYLAGYADKRYARIGSLFEPDYEALSALGPDLIIVGGRSRAKYAELSRIAPTLDLTGDAAQPYASDLVNIATLGQLFGKDREAAALVARIQASVAALRQKAMQAGKGLFLLVTGGRISAYGPGSRFGMIHDVFGVAPAMTNIKPGVHGQPISYELIRKANPDWLFVLDRDAAIGRQKEGQAAATLLDNELVGQTTAWKTKQVVYLDAPAWYLSGGGAQSLQGAIDQLTQAFSRPR